MIDQFEHLDYVRSKHSLDKRVSVKSNRVDLTNTILVVEIIVRQNIDTVWVATVKKRFVVKTNLE